MNNDNLKRILNKIGGAAQQQSEDQIEQTTPPPLTPQGKINKYCDCVKHLLFTANDLVYGQGGWDEHVKWITTYCLGNLARRGVGQTPVDSVAYAQRNCRNFDINQRYGDCRLKCFYLKGDAAKFNRCIYDCIADTHPWFLKFLY